MNFTHHLLLVIEPQFSLEFLIRFMINLVAIYIIARQIYYRIREKRDYLFTLFMFNILIFFVTFLLNSVELSIGFAFGIFAIFSILRYRTQTVPIKEMTYLFISIAIAIINSLSYQAINYYELAVINIIIIGITLILEKVWVKNEVSKNILYEKIDMILPGKYEELKHDLENRTGLVINRVEIGRIDFMRDIANVKIFYFEDNQPRAITDFNEDE